MPNGVRFVHEPENTEGLARRIADEAARWAALLKSREEPT